MISIVDKNDCCGCNACGDICPKNAISFHRDEEGFLYPVVDKALCVECGLCEKTCPQLHAEEMKVNEFSAPKSYAMVHKNLTVRFDSTSGGMFSALANVIYRKGGYVGGAIWTEDFFIRQYISDNKTDLPKLRSSKYAQSDAQGFYAAVKEALLTGKPVLVCGTPCQMVALRAFLGKPYENLTVVDFICRGNNSPTVFRKYLDWHEGQQGSKVVYVKAKNKEQGWRKLTTKLVFKNKSVVYDTHETSYFTKGYLSTNAYCRPSCYACPYKGFPRYSDITLADCWGAKELLGEEFDRDLGTSLVFANNSKGETLIQATGSSILLKAIDFETVRKGNPMLEASLPPPKCDRKRFFEVLNNEGFQGVIDQFLKNINENSLKSRVKRVLKRYLMLLRTNHLNVVSWWHLIRINGLCRVLMGKPVFTGGKRTIIENKGALRLEGDCAIGTGYYKATPHETRIGIQKGGTLHLKGDTTFTYGADIEVFNGATLEIGKGCGFNLCCNIICGEKIVIGEKVMAGRHVTIRDNNGGHWINFPGYKNTKPVIIGDHAWLCEGCTIMPGVTIGAGAIIGAKAVVFNNVPANTMVMGNPAQIVCENVEWKY